MINDSIWGVVVHAAIIFIDFQCQVSAYISVFRVVSRLENHKQ